MGGRTSVSESATGPKSGTLAGGDSAAHLARQLLNWAAQCTWLAAALQLCENREAIPTAWL
jgi:hypothetical protein